MTGHEQPKLGIIAGGGRLPAILAAVCRTSNRPYSLVALRGAADPEQLGESPSLWMRLGEAAKGFAKLREDGVEQVVVAGKVQRPTLGSLMPDWRTTAFLARVSSRAFLSAKSYGDDKLLRAVVAEIESEGFEVVGVDTVVPDLLAKAGPVGAVEPSEAELADISVGLAAARELGRKDVGQAVVVHKGAVVREEDADGTDALIAAVASHLGNTSGAILVKTMKPGQDRRADLPAIGPDTVEACAAAGLSGIAVGAGNTLVIDARDVVKKADAASVFVFGATDTAGAM